MPDYIDNTYSTLKEKVGGFNRNPDEFRHKMLNDPAYRENVRSTRSEKVDGFKRTPEEFDGLVGVKKKRYIRIPLPCFRWYTIRWW